MPRAVTLAAYLLVALAAGVVGARALPPSGLRGHYYDNVTRSGAPVATVIDVPSTDTLDNGTAGGWQAFSVEWTGAIVIPSSGLYRFSTTSDDGSELEIDDHLVVPNGGKHGTQEVSGTIALDAGVHTMRLRYEQDGGGFTLSVRYAIDGEKLRPIPASVLIPDAMSTTAYLGRLAVPFAAALVAVLLVFSAARAYDRRGPPSDERQRLMPILDRPGVALAIVIVAALAMRVFMMLGSSDILWGDSDVFLATVDDILAGKYFEHDPFRTLLYPYFLAAFLGISRAHPMDQVVVGAQHLLGVLSAAAFFILARRAFGTRVALCGGLLFAAHTTQLFYENSILSEAFFIAVLGVSLLAIVRFIESPSWPRAVGTAVACLALTYTRPVAQWYVLVPVVLMVAAVRRPLTWLKYAAVIVGIYIAALMPWAALNQRTFGFYGVAIGQGLGLFIRVFEIEGFEQPPDTQYPEVKEVLDLGRATAQYSPATFVRDELKRRRHSTAQTDRLMNGASMEAIAASPVRFALGTLRQWWRLLGGPLGDEQICPSAQFGPYVCSARTVGYAREPFLNQPRSTHEPVRSLVVGYFRHFALPMHVVSALAAFGAVAVLAAAEINITGVLIAVTAAYFTFLPAAAQSPQDRYRLPVDGLLFMLAVYGASQLPGALTSWRARGATRRYPE